MSEPDANPLAIRTLETRIRVEIGGYLLADSDAVLEVREQGHEPVLYFPAEAVHMNRLKAVSDTSYCPRKGQASYYTIAVGSCFEANAVWSYQDPLPNAQQLSGYLAFRGDGVDGFDAEGQRVIGPAACASCD